MSRPEDLIKDVIPPEHKISKMKLWDRIDHTRSVSEQHVIEMSSALEKAIGEMKIVVREANEELIEEASRIKKSLIEEFDSHIADINLKTKDIQVKTENLIKNQNSNIERKIKDFNDSSENMVKSLSSDFYADLSIELKNLKNQFFDLHNGVNKSLSDYQMEVRSKVSVLDGKLDKVISTLKQFFKEI